MRLKWAKQKSASKKEVKHIFDGLYENLKEDEKKLTKEEKKELRAFLEKMDDSSIHVYCHILIKRFIRKMVNKRTEHPIDTHDIKDIHE